MNITPHTPNINPTMSSREIAELCEKQHKHILRDIEKMLQDIAEPKFGPRDFEATYIDSRGKEQREMRLPKDLTLTLVSGYRADLRYRIIKRMDELETNLIPQNYPDALRLAAQQAEQIEEMMPKAAAMDLLEGSEGSQIPRVAAKVLEQAERKFFKWLHANSWAYRQGKIWVGYSEKIKQGYLEHEPRTYTVQETGEERTAVQLKITPKGMARLAQIFAKGSPA